MSSKQERDLVLAKYQVDSLIESPRLFTYSKWERDFIESIQEQLEENDTLSGKQLAKLNEIYERYF